MARLSGEVTFEDAETALGDAIEYLGALPDRDASYLAAGKRSGWPKVLRITQEDYPDRPDPRMRLGRREMAHLDAVLLSDDALAFAIPEPHRALVGRVLVMKRWPDAGGFRWNAVRRAMLARSSDGQRVPASDALRMRYERSVAKVAGVMAGRGWRDGKAPVHAAEAIPTVRRANSAG